MPLVPLPTLTFDAVVVILNNITNWVFIIGLVIAPIMIIVAAFIFLTSGANPSQMSTAKKIVLWTVIGLIVILIARGFFAVLSGLVGA